MKYGERLKIARKHKKLSQPRLAELSGVGQGTISKIERGDQEFSGYDSILSKILDIHPFWLTDGDPNYKPEWLDENTFTTNVDNESNTDCIAHNELNEPPTIYSNAIMLDGFDLWDSTTPLRDDEVAIPFFREVKLSAGKGISEVQENHGAKLRFAKSTLKRKGVSADHAACVVISGNSMEPVLPNGSTVGINTAITEIVNGKMYAIDHNGELRVKLLYTMPGGGLRLRSYNIDEYPDEPYTDPTGLRILGQVFWYSVLL